MSTISSSEVECGNYFSRRGSINKIVGLAMGMFCTKEGPLGVGYQCRS